MLFIWLFLIVFIITLFITLFKAIGAAFQNGKYKPPDMEETDDTSELNRLERIDNYDRQIDGYTQLIKSLDNLLLVEYDEKKRAAILAKQLTALEKLNKTIEKREKLE